MQLPIYQVDAFSANVFSGNPAAVMPLDDWLADGLLQSIAAENNLSETAFFVPQGGHFELRWFTPEVEVKLCGHATLAAAHVLFEHRGHPGEHIAFESRSGSLRVERSQRGLTLDFPADNLVPVDVGFSVCSALGATASEAMAPVGGGAHLYVYDYESDVAALAPDFAALKRAGINVIATAPGDSCDFVSRFFGPLVGINEDPVTGSAHCSLVPYWSGRLGRGKLEARQISARGGQLACEYRDGRVMMTGRSVTFMTGIVTL